MGTVSIDQQALKLGSSNPGMLDRWAKKQVFKWLASLAQGHLTLDDQGERHHFGQPSAEATIAAHIIVHHDSAYRDVLFNGSPGFGEAYMKGSWESPDLVNVIRLMCNNRDKAQRLDRGWSKFNGLLGRIAHRMRANKKANARLNIAAHYDLGNDFFSQFLDPTMMYSAAIYPREDATLAEAATYKLEHICQRLQLRETDHLLEIGTGWGGMAIHAARHYGCRVTTTTISQQQRDYAVKAVVAAGLEDKITVLFDDYRDLEGQFDKLVSIEMIEAVGREFLSSYFSVCSRLLKDSGLMLLQAITRPEQYYDPSNRSSDFIQRYIFPGGDLPSLGAMCRQIGEVTDLRIVGLEDLTSDYAKTLAAWRKAFFDRLAVIKAQGYGDIFIRMWDFYLSYCEGGFRERLLGSMQLLLSKPRYS